MAHRLKNTALVALNFRAFLGSNFKPVPRIGPRSTRNDYLDSTLRRAKINVAMIRIATASVNWTISVHRFGLIRMTINKQCVS